MNIKMIKRIYEYWLDWKFSAKIISTLVNVTLWSIAVLVIVNYITNVNQTTEQTGTELMTLGQQSVTRAAEQVNAGAKLLQTLAKTPSIVDAVMEANNRRADWTPQFIALQDESWTKEDPSIETTVQEVAGNPISAYLLDFRKNNPEEVEIFVTDAQGLNIAMTNRTSDFLQADEDWWRLAFANGNGSVYFGQVEYDESAAMYAMKIGVPIVHPETNRAIGVLRGTLDISILMSTLEDVKVGKTGNVVLIDSEGTVLYSHNPAHLMKPSPVELLKPFESGQSGWEQTTDIDGKPAIVAHSFLGGFLGQSLGWRMLITQQRAELNQGILRRLVISVLASLFVAAFAMLVGTIVLGQSVAKPLAILTQTAQELSMGNIMNDESDQEKARLRLRKDEIGILSKAFDRLIQYFRAGVAASTAIADNDLTITVAPNSEKDELGVAFAKMLAGLQQVIGQVAENARAVSCAAAQLAEASRQSRQASSQIALTIQQVALGTTRQSEEASKTTASVDQMNHAITEMARGTQEQARAVSTASTVTAQISSAIEQVTASARSSARGAREAAEVAHLGAQTVEASVASMEVIKTKVSFVAQKIKEMGQRSEQIDGIVEMIDDIASQTNMLALNAAIEAARVETKGEKTVESILQQHLLGVTSLVADILARGQELGSEELITLAQHARVDQFSISDADGNVVAASNPGSIGFRFSEDPGHQSSVFRPLLNQRDGVVIQPIRAREQDNKPFVFVGVSRRDRPGIVQAGITGELVYRLGGYSRGFAVVASEIRKLAEHAKSATKEISTMIRNIQKMVGETTTLMADGHREVEKGAVRAAQAGESLATILHTVEAVNRQVEEIATAVQHIDTSSRELVSAVNGVSLVVQENTAATGEMAAHSSEMTQAMENIASVSEENSAAVEEVSASTEEVSAQVEQVAASASSLMEAAQSLQEVVAQFKLNLEHTDTSIALQSLEGIRVKSFA